EEQCGEQRERAQVPPAKLVRRSAHGPPTRGRTLSRTQMATMTSAKHHHCSAYDQLRTGSIPGGCQSRTYPYGSRGSSSRIRGSRAVPNVLLSRVMLGKVVSFGDGDWAVGGART